MKSMRGVLWVFICVLSFILAAAFLYSCSSSGGGGTDNSGTVAVYATGGSLNSLATSTTGTTDSSLNTDLTSTETGTNLDTGGTSTNGEDGHSLLTRMTATITRIELVNKGTGTSCTVLDEPSSLGIGDLSNLMNFIAEANCPAASYNRVHIEFERDFLVEDKDGHDSSCALTSFRGMGNQPNVLQCSGSICTLDINGAVNVLMKQRNNLSLNFNIKEFDVQGFGTSGACTVTLKTSPICSSQTTTEVPSNLPESITGLVSHVSPSAQTFDLTMGHKTYAVLYSGITSSQQPGLEDVLQRAQDDGLRLTVLASNIKPSGGVIPATSLFLNIEGVISNLDTGKGTCTITYQHGGTIDILYQDVANEGSLKDGAWIQLKITGYDGDRFIASDSGTGNGGSTTGS
jgi:hypothetical protein